MSRVGFLAHRKALKAGDWAAYREAVGEEGARLAREGVAEAQAAEAVALHLGVCLSVLFRGDEQRALVVALARLAASHIREIVLGYDSGRRAGWRRLDEQERLRLSRDLHDEVGADLVVMKLYLQMIATELEKGRVATATGKLAESLALVGRTIESVRRLTLDLGPALLEQIGLLGAARLYARQFSERTGIGVEFAEAGLPDGSPSSHETALYRVLQGALSNVGKHAQAKNVRVTLGGFRDAVVVMIVEDDGVGFNVQKTGDHFGLTAMRERISGLGGHLHIESRTARAGKTRTGTRIEVDLPVKGKR